ncbi:glycoside hydrolase family 3 N-terminal domain-containing protein, partial [Variovorax sp. CT11-76]
MKFDTPATTNAIDQLKVIGRPTDRIDGPVKTTGSARYAYERHAEVPGAAYGYVIGAGIAKGRIASMDLRAAQAAPGVLAIVTARNAGKLAKGDFNTAKLLAGPEIDHYHQAVAVVVAQSFEQARAAAQLVRIEYTRAAGRFDLAAEMASAKPPKASAFSGEPDTRVGDFAGAFAAAPVQLDATYSTPDESHAMMEPHASIAQWQGDRLTIWTANQMIAWGVGDVAKTLGIPKENVRLVSPFIGGGFGGKLFVRADALLATPKHFAGYGAAEGGLDYNTVDISERTLREVYLPPFRAALDAGALSLMSGFHEISGIPSTANPALLTGVLRGEWGFRGFVVSDYTADEELIAHGYAANGREAAKQAFLAGTDMSMQSGLYMRELPGLVAAGEVPMARLDDAVRRVLYAKLRLGLFDQPMRGRGPGLHRAG